MLIYLLVLLLKGCNKTLRMQWYEQDVQEAESERQKCTYDPETIFYGSSTIRLWKTIYKDFNGYKPVNLGFGGSTLAACVWFFERLIVPLKGAKKMIFYAGDNDLGDGRHPEEVYLFYRQFLVTLREHFETLPFYFVSIKPSIDRIDIIDKIQYTNKLIKEEIDKGSGNEKFVNVYDKMIENGEPMKHIFEEDGLHLNKKGYAIWKEIILKECLAA